MPKFLVTTMWMLKGTTVVEVDTPEDIMNNLSELIEFPLEGEILPESMRVIDIQREH